jgi:hypothetical protein
MSLALFYFIYLFNFFLGIYMTKGEIFVEPRLKYRRDIITSAILQVSYVETSKIPNIFRPPLPQASTELSNPELLDDVRRPDRSSSHNAQSGTMKQGNGHERSACSFTGVKSL